MNSVLPLASGIIPNKSKQLHVYSSYLQIAWFAANLTCFPSYILWIFIHRMNTHLSRFSVVLRDFTMKPYTATSSNPCISLEARGSLRGWKHDIFEYNPSSIIHVFGNYREIRLQTHCISSTCVVFSLVAYMLQCCFAMQYQRYPYVKTWQTGWRGSCNYK